MAEFGRYPVMMGLQPGDLQFINTFHIPHDRTVYVDDRATGACGT